MIPLPPPNMALVGWRDPFIFETKGKSGNGREWGMLIGSGVKNLGGAVLIYRSTDLLSGWRYDGMLCESDDSTETGAMWECPLLLELTQASEDVTSRSPLSRRSSGVVPGGRLGKEFSSPAAVAHAARAELAARDGLAAVTLSAEDGAAARNGEVSSPSPSPAPSPSKTADGPYSPGERSPPEHTHLLCISPDAPTNPVLYWLGSYDAEATRFQLEGAKGPLLLDLGNTLYAPNLMTDSKVCAVCPG